MKYASPFFYPLLIVPLIVSICLGGSDLHLGGSYAPGQNTAAPTASGDHSAIEADTSRVNVLRFIPSHLHAAIAARTDATDLSAQIQSAYDNVSALSSSSGYLHFPDGLYKYASPLVLTGKRNVFTAGNRFNTAGKPMGAELRFTGAGSGAAIVARGSYGVQFRNMTLTYSNPNFAGRLIDPRGDSGRSTQHFALDSCSLYGVGARGARALVDMDRVINSRIEKSYFLNADIAILGATNYSNSILIKKNVFQDLTTSAMKDSGEAWLIQNNTFQSLYNLGNPGRAGAYIHTQSSPVSHGMTWDTNWFGDVKDASEGAGIWIQWAGSGFTFRGGVMGLTDNTVGIRFDEDRVSGIDISGVVVYRAGIGGVHPVFVQWATTGHGPMRIGPNHLWYSDPSGKNLVEIQGDLPAGSIYQSGNADGVADRRGLFHIGSTDAASGFSKVLSTMTEWRPGSIANNGSATTSVRLKGAQKGDVVHASFTGTDTAGWMISASVIGEDNVAVTILNRTGESTAPAGNLRVDGWRH